LNDFSDILFLYYFGFAKLNLLFTIGTKVGFVIFIRKYFHLCATVRTFKNYRFKVSKLLKSWAMLRCWHDSTSFLKKLLKNRMRMTLSSTRYSDYSISKILMNIDKVKVRLKFYRKNTQNRAEKPGSVFISVGGRLF